MNQCAQQDRETKCKNDHIKKRVFLISFLIIGFNNFICAQVSGWQWAKSAGGMNQENASGVTKDASGNLYMVGSFASPTIAFGACILINDSSGFLDIFIVKYDPSGNVIWAKSAGGTEDDCAASVVTDASGNIVLTGYFSSQSICFGSSTLTNVSPGSKDVFIVKYDASGNPVWAKSEGGTSDDNGNGLTCDAHGNFVVVGDFGGTGVTFGSTTLSNFGSYNSFVVKYDASGTVLWAKSSGGNVTSSAQSVVSDVSGNYIVAGIFTGTNISFGPNTLVNVSFVPGFDSYIVKYDSSGTVIWARSAGGVMDDFIRSVTTDLSGNIFVTGDYRSNSINFGSTTIYNWGNGDAFIVKYNPSGNVLWGYSIGGSGYEAATSVVTDAFGNSIVTGGFDSGSLWFGNFNLNNPNPNFPDIFIVKYGPSGTVAWVKSAGGNNIDFSTCIITDGAQNLVVVGNCSSPSLYFGSIYLTNVSQYDMFIAKLGNLTGIEEWQENETFVIAPNPFTTQTTLSFSQEQKHTNIKIVDPLGREIEVVNFTGKQFVLDKGRMEAGIYFVEITTSDKYQCKKKFIIQ